MVTLKKTAEEQLRVLFTEHSSPPLEVIIPILETAKRGERELAAQEYETSTGLAKGIIRILGLKDKDMKTLSKVVGTVFRFGGQELQPVERSDSRFSFFITDCPMLHVGKDVSQNVKNKFCDLLCTSGSKALMDAVLGKDAGTCTWDKALIKGATKCVVVFDLVKTG